jgi:hypothetical protein
MTDLTRARQSAGNMVSSFASSDKKMENDLKIMEDDLKKPKTFIYSS